MSATIIALQAACDFGISTSNEKNLTFHEGVFRQNDTFDAWVSLKAQ
jgi:hypothetical protein